MTDATDTGSSQADNITSDTTPDFSLVCTEAGSTLTLYVDGVANATATCTAATDTPVVTVNADLAEGDYVVTVKEVDVAGNAETKSDCGSTGVPIHSLPSSRLRRISFDGSD